MVVSIGCQRVWKDDVCDVKEQKFKYKTMIECENLDPTGLKIRYATNNGE